MAFSLDSENSDLCIAKGLYSHAAMKLKRIVFVCT